MNALKEQIYSTAKAKKYLNVDAEEWKWMVSNNYLSPATEKGKKIKQGTSNCYTREGLDYAFTKLPEMRQAQEKSRLLKAALTDDELAEIRKYTEASNVFGNLKEITDKKIKDFLNERGKTHYSDEEVSVYSFRSEQKEPDEKAVREMIPESMLKNRGIVKESIVKTNLIEMSPEIVRDMIEEEISLFRKYLQESSGKGFQNYQKSCNVPDKYLNPILEKVEKGKAVERTEIVDATIRLINGELLKPSSSKSQFGAIAKEGLQKKIQKITNAARSGKNYMCIFETEFPDFFE